MVHHTGNTVEQFLLRQLGVIDAHSQRDQALLGAVCAACLTLRSKGAFSRKANIAQAKLVQASTQRSKHVLCLDVEDGRCRWC